MHFELLFKDFVFFYKKGQTGKEYKGFAVEAVERTNYGRIRCPKCKWQPSKSSRWYCSDCLEPEFYLDGCGTAWNTFETRGVCPGCKHGWRWTSCLSCGEWSRHEDWYNKQRNDFNSE